MIPQLNLPYTFVKVKIILAVGMLTRDGEIIFREIALNNAIFMFFAGIVGGVKCGNRI